MPHSPRWYGGRLWVLHSGTGGLGGVDLATGRYDEVVKLPGFTRGLDFAGPLAFVGLSQVRESAVFSGIPIAERPVEERCCGVWVIHIETGRVVAFVKFEDAFRRSSQCKYCRDGVTRTCSTMTWSGSPESFVLPDDALRDVAECFRKPAEPPAAG